jgi:hypothetical protein
MIDLQQDELNILVDALGEKPFKEVSSLITKLQQPIESVAMEFNSSIGINTTSTILLG